MAETVHTVDDTKVGAALASGGFVVGIVQTKGGPYTVPEFDPGRQKWTQGYFCLRDTGAFRPVICVSPQTTGQPGGNWMTGGSRPVIGDLVAESVPRGSEWRITTADVLTVRKPFT
jgi:hypothetical protein